MAGDRLQASGKSKTKSLHRRERRVTQREVKDLSFREQGPAASAGSKRRGIWFQCKTHIFHRRGRSNLILLDSVQVNPFLPPQGAQSNAEGDLYLGKSKDCRRQEGPGP